MFKIKPRWDEGKVGSSFEMVLPLKKPITVKETLTGAKK